MRRPLCALLCRLVYPAEPSVYQDLKTRNPGKALVLWYSQTGLTGRYGKQIACILQEESCRGSAGPAELTVRVPDYDLLVFGSPVFYYESPSM